MVAVGIDAMEMILICLLLLLPQRQPPPSLMLLSTSFANQLMLIWTSVGTTSWLLQIEFSHTCLICHHIVFAIINKVTTCFIISINNTICSK